MLHIPLVAVVMVVMGGDDRPGRFWIILRLKELGWCILASGIVGIEAAQGGIGNRLQEIGHSSQPEENWIGCGRR